MNLGSIPPIHSQKAGQDAGAAHAGSSQAGHSQDFDALRGVQAGEKGPLQCKFSDCKKKMNELLISIHTCACGKVFCPMHRSTVTHQCTFDYVAQQQERLQLQQSSLRQSRGGDHKPSSDESH